MNHADIVISQGPERCAQRNAGADAASHDVVIFVDSDMELQPQVCAQAAAALAADPRWARWSCPRSPPGKASGRRAGCSRKSSTWGTPTWRQPAPTAVVPSRPWAVGTSRLPRAKTGTSRTGFAPQVGRSGRIEALVVHQEGRVQLTAQFSKKRYYGQWTAAYLTTRAPTGSDGSLAGRCSVSPRRWPETRCAPAAWYCSSRWRSPGSSPAPATLAADQRSASRPGPACCRDDDRAAPRDFNACFASWDQAPARGGHDAATDRPAVLPQAKPARRRYRRMVRGRNSLAATTVPSLIAFTVAFFGWFQSDRYFATGDVVPFERRGLFGEFGWLWTHGHSGGGSPNFEIARLFEVIVIRLVELVGGGGADAQRVWLSLCFAFAAFGGSALGWALTRRATPTIVSGLAAAFNAYLLVQIPNPIPMVTIGVMGMLTAQIVAVARGGKVRPLRFAFEHAVLLVPRHQPAAAGRRRRLDRSGRAGRQTAVGRGARRPPPLLRSAAASLSVGGGPQPVVGRLPGDGVAPRRRRRHPGRQHRRGVVVLDPAQQHPGQRVDVADPLGLGSHRVLPLLHLVGKPRLGRFPLASPAGRVPGSAAHPGRVPAPRPLARSAGRRFRPGRQRTSTSLSPGSTCGHTATCRASGCCANR